MLNKKLIIAVMLALTGVMLAACGSPAEEMIRSPGLDALSAAEAEAAVRAACAGDYDSPAECERCVGETLSGMNGPAGLDGVQIAQLQSMFAHGECEARGIKTRVEICHVPPGNPDNAHTISISPNAVAAHLAHGDSEGPCENTVAAVADFALRAQSGSIQNTSDSGITMTTLVISYGPPFVGNGTWATNNGTSLAGGVPSDFLSDPAWFQTITFEGLSISPGESFVYSGLDHDVIFDLGPPATAGGGSGSYATAVVRADFSNGKSAEGQFANQSVQIPQTVLLTETGP